MPEASTASGVSRTPYRVEAPNDWCLQAYEWRAAGPVRGAVVIVHGLRDHAVRYDALADAFTKQGLAVYAQDLRGHGRSGGDRQRLDSMDELVADVGLAVAEARKRNPGVPVFLFGHSLGGLISTTRAVKHGAELNGLMLSGPALKLLPGVSGADKAGAKFFSALLPGLKVQELDDTQFVRDDSARKDLAADPLVDHANLPARTAATALNAIDSIQEHLAEVKVPFLVMHGTVDTATNLDGSVALAEKAASADKTLKKWEGAHHDLLHEPERQQVIELLVAWVVERLPKTP